MTRKRVVLGQMGWPYDGSVYWPLAAAMLASACKADPAFNAVYEIDPHLRYARQDPAEFVDQLDEPDVLGLSMYVWCEQATLEAARLTKERFPNCLIVLGGPSVSGWDFRTPEALLRRAPFVDVVIDGEGEHTFRELLLASRWLDVPGVAFIDMGDVYRQAAERPRERDLSVFPSPFLDGTLDAVLKHGRRKGVRFEGVWETSRGCPFACTFLYVGLGDRHQDGDVPARSAPRGDRMDRPQQNRLRLHG